MRSKSFLIVAIVAAGTQFVLGQEGTGDRLKRALDGRMILVKTDLPATAQGMEMTYDDTALRFDQNKHNADLKQHGVAIKSGTKAKITGVSLVNNVLVLELDGGGAPGHGVVIGGNLLTDPAPTAKSERELAIERQLQNEAATAIVNPLRAELEAEQQRRHSQDERNRAAYERAIMERNKYISQNRKNWGSRLTIVIQSKKDPLPFREIAQSISKYAELMPREAAPKP